MTARKIKSASARARTGSRSVSYYIIDVSHHQIRNCLFSLLFFFFFGALCIERDCRCERYELCAAFTLEQTTAKQKNKKRNSNSHNDHWKHVRNYFACFSLSVFALIHFQFEAHTNVTIQFLAGKRNHISFPHTHTTAASQRVRWRRFVSPLKPAVS